MGHQHNDRFYMTVDALTTEVSEVTLSNGEEVTLHDLGGNACYSTSVKIEIKFGTTILFSTHGDAVHEVEISCVGDGSKKLAIRLVNDSLTSETIGGYYKGTCYAG